MKGARYGHSSTFMGNSLIVAGGYAIPDVDSIEPESLASVESYSVLHEKWESLSAMPIPAAFGSLVKANENIFYLLGGI